MSAQDAAERDAAKILRQTPQEDLKAWLASRRWYADKGREISGITFESVLSEQVGPRALSLCITRVEFRDGGEALYFVPLTLAERPEGGDRIATITLDGQHLEIADGVLAPEFGEWFRDRFAPGRSNEDTDWEFALHPDGRSTWNASRAERPRVMGAEQSNTSIRYGDIMIAKLIRRLQPGPNPDEEVLRALAGMPRAWAPAFVGGVRWNASDTTTYPVALLQAFVPNTGDGWSWMLARLAGIASGAFDPERDEFEPERLLGRRTGELHLALAAVEEPAFVPMAATTDDLAEDRARVLTASATAIDLIHDNQSRMPAALQHKLPEIESRLRETDDLAAGFADEVGLARIRVHGDYHLGQTLRTLDHDWTVVDFEGEPGRPCAERRQRFSVLKDVAGMLRSFGYARGVAERAASEEHPAAGKALAAWERGARLAFLGGYRTAIGKSPTPLAPQDDEAFSRALRAWEIDKALYEVAYEARNRPDWIGIPLRALLPEGAPQDDTTAGAPA